MAQIIASTKEISNKRESLIVLSNSLKNKISLLETLGNSLNSMWEGAAKEKYVKQLKTDISKMRNLLKTILEFILILAMRIPNVWLQCRLNGIITERRTPAL